MKDSGNCRRDYFFLCYYVIIELGGKFTWRVAGRCARATRPWRPADVSALPRRLRRVRTTSGRQCARSESFARLPTHANFSRWYIVVQKFCHPPPGRRRRARFTARPRRVGRWWAAAVVWTAGGQVVSTGGNPGGWRGLKFRNGFSSSKPPPVAPYTNPLR